MIKESKELNLFKKLLLIYITAPNNNLKDIIMMPPKMKELKPKIGFSIDSIVGSSESLKRSQKPSSPIPSRSHDLQDSFRDSYEKERDRVSPSSNQELNKQILINNSATSKKIPSPKTTNGTSITEETKLQTEEPHQKSTPHETHHHPLIIHPNNFNPHHFPHSSFPPPQFHPPGILNFAAIAAAAANAHQPNWIPPGHPIPPHHSSHPLYPWLLAKHSRFFPPRFGPDLQQFLFQPFRKPKRIRTAFSPTQLLKLEHAFEKNHYVVGAERKTLAKSLSLSETQVKVWFQNRRTKHKRVETEEDPNLINKKPDGRLSTSADSSTKHYNDDDEDIIMEDEYSDEDHDSRGGYSGVNYT